MKPVIDVLNINKNKSGEKSPTFYHDIRFWIVCISFISMLYAIIESYPPY